jgi:hypothetical protein
VAQQGVDIPRGLLVGFKRGETIEEIGSEGVQFLNDIQRNLRKVEEWLRRVLEITEILTKRKGSIDKRKLNINHI